VALLIGGIEASGVIREQLKLTGGVWDLVGSLDDNIGALGFMIIGVFVLCWLGSVIVYRIKGFDQLDSAATLNPE
jgi:nickel/cobalt transporter (NiCoT) family protein